MALVLVGCSGTLSPTSESSAAPATGTSTSSNSPTSGTFRGPSPCDLVPTDQVSRLLQAAVATIDKSGGACRWFAADTNRNAQLGVSIYPTPAAATTTFQSEQLFNARAQPYAFGDRGYTASTPAQAGFQSQGAAKVLIGAAIVTAVVNDLPGPEDDVAAAKTIVEKAGARVRQGWHP
jgi:hypothetical protein